jgi:uncharacterized protein YhbP (UPF0306 family)
VEVNVQDLARSEILSILAEGRDMTIATIRSDGYPQATTVNYVHQDLSIYFGCDRSSQKARNLASNAKISAAINVPYSTPDDIRGISLGGEAHLVSEAGEIETVSRLMFRRFPRLNLYAGDPGSLVFYRVTSKVISLINHRLGFGRSQLIYL